VSSPWLYIQSEALQDIVFHLQRVGVRLSAIRNCRPGWLMESACWGAREHLVMPSFQQTAKYEQRRAINRIS
jgi:hypothetical protein